MSSSTAAMAGGGSTSTVSAEEATGRHVFKVQGYSKYRASAAGGGKTVTSGVFGVGGHTWRIDYLPCCSCGGYRSTDWICFGLQRDSRAADGGVDVVQALFTLSLLGEDGEPLPSYTRVSRHQHLKFSRNTPSYGCHFGCFIQSRTLDSLYLEADCFRVRCDIGLLLETRDESVQPSPDLDLHRHLGSLLASGVGGDVTFEVGKETFVAHKNVLAARSPVFMAEFFGGMMEDKEATARVRIFGIHARAFKAMLHFIYTDSLPEIDDDDKIVMAQHLLVAADRYDIQRLKLICENKLCNFVNASLVATTLVLAEKHGFRRLKEACFKVLRYGDNFKALGYDDYHYMIRSCPNLLGEFIDVHMGR